MNRDLSISEIMKRLRRASSEPEFYAVQAMLTDRETNRDKIAQIEIENLTRDRDSLKQRVALLEKAESEKSKAEERLKKARTKFEDMKLVIDRLRSRNSELNRENEDLRRKIVEYDEKLAPRFKKLEQDFAELLEYRGGDRLGASSNAGEEEMMIIDRNPNKDSKDSDDDSCSSSIVEDLIQEIRSKIARQKSMNEKN